MKMEKRVNKCKGCFSLKVGMNKKHYVCVSVDRGVLDSCPCQSCLIKAVCNEFCDDYMDLWHQDLKTYTRSIVFFKTGSKDELSEWQSCIK